MTTSVVAEPVHIEMAIIGIKNPTVQNREWFLKPTEYISVDRFAPFSELDNQLEPAVELLGQPIPIPSQHMNDFLDIIEKNPNYELLNHLSWAQEVVSKSRSIPVSLDVGNSEILQLPQKLVSGEILVHQLTGLYYVDIKANYQPLPEDDGTVYYYSLPFSSGINVSLSVIDEHFELKERRQIKIDNYYHFDHPKFQIIFFISRLKKPEVFAQ